MLSTFRVVMAILGWLGFTIVSLAYLSDKRLPNYERARHLIQVVANLIFLAFMVYDVFTPVPSVELDCVGFYFRAMGFVFISTAWAASATITYMPVLLGALWEKVFVYTSDPTSETAQGE